MCLISELDWDAAAFLKCLLLKEKRHNSKMALKWQSKHCHVLKRNKMWPLLQGRKGKHNHRETCSCYADTCFHTFISRTTLSRRSLFFINAASRMKCLTSHFDLISFGGPDANWPHVWLFYDVRWCVWEDFTVQLKEEAKRRKCDKVVSMRNWFVDASESS